MQTNLRSMKRMRMYSANIAPQMYTRKKRSGVERLHALEHSVQLKVIKTGESREKNEATTDILASAPWKFNRAHSGVEFSARHFKVVNVSGRFNNFDIKIFSSAADFSDAAVELTIRTDSIDTGNAQRDGELRGENWFDAEKFPTINFNSTQVKKLDDKNYEITGNISIHGISHTVTLNATFNGMYTDTYPKKTIAGFTIRGVLNREKFQLGGDEGATGVDYEIAIGADIEFVKE